MFILESVCRETSFPILLSSFNPGLLIPSADAYGLQVHVALGSSEQTSPSSSVPLRAREDALHPNEGDPRDAQARMEAWVCGAPEAAHPQLLARAPGTLAWALHPGRTKVFLREVWCCRVAGAGEGITTLEW
jgi:hypothetical protein